MPLDGSEFKFEIDETTKLLIAAREMVERGWCQRAIEKEGRVCAVGGLTRNTISRLVDPIALSNAYRRLEQAIGGEISDWNDALERTQADVLAAYDIAIVASLSGSAYP